MLSKTIETILISDNGSKVAPLTGAGGTADADAGSSPSRIVEAFQRLPDAILVDLDVLRAQVFHFVVMLVASHEVEQNLLRARAESGIRVCVAGWTLGV